MDRPTVTAELDTKNADMRRSAVSAGLVGRAIGQSRTPRMHMAEGARCGIQYDYHLFDFDLLGLEDRNLPELIGRLGDEGYSGVNVTHPFKEKVVDCLDRLSPEAASIGAVNTVVFDEGGTAGHNTDCWGFSKSFSAGLATPRLDDVVLIGAGGAGMAVARALLDLGVERLAVFDALAEKAEQVSRSLCAGLVDQYVASISDLREAVGRADGIVNATPVGMAKYPGMPVAREWLRPEVWVADIVYFPAETELLRTAREIGCATLPGAGMAIFQAVKAFELITGIIPDAAQMARHFDAD